MILVVSYTDVTLFQRYEARQAVAKTHYEEQKKQYQQSLAGDAAAPAVGVSPIQPFRLILILSSLVRLSTQRSLRVLLRRWTLPLGPLLKRRTMRRTMKRTKMAMMNLLLLAAPRRMSRKQQNPRSRSLSRSFGSRLKERRRRRKQRSKRPTTGLLSTLHRQKRTMTHVLDCRPLKITSTYICSWFVAYLLYCIICVPVRLQLISVFVPRPN